MMNTGLVAVMVIFSTLVSMGAGIFFNRGEYSWTWGLIAIDFFIVFFGILLPFRFHYQRSYRHYGRY